MCGVNILIYLSAWYEIPEYLASMIKELLMQLRYYYSLILEYQDAKVGQRIRSSRDINKFHKVYIT